MKQYSPLTDFFTASSVTVAPRSTAAQQALRGYMRYAKRGMDITLSLLMLPMVIPVLLILSILLRRDGGPALFVQPRVGLGGRVFNCYKLRTMAVDAEAKLRRLCDSDPEIAREWHENQKLAVDPRITRVGAFLRKTSLDELPQLLNILKGEMSLVGPRPFMTDQQDLYVAAGGAAYFHMRPGVTGLWQVEGRGTTRFVDRVKYDEIYFAKASLGTDFGLLLRTVGVVFRMTGH
jgi:exopolysaccharide production protein ExoY